MIKKEQVDNYILGLRTLYSCTEITQICETYEATLVKTTQEMGQAKELRDGMEAYGWELTRPNAIDKVGVAWKFDTGEVRIGE